MNQLKTVMLMGVITVLLVLAGGSIGGQSGMIMALLIAFALNVGSYWFSDKIVLSMYHAREVDESSAPWLYSAVRKLVANAGLPMPKVYVIPDAQPNAFATGRDPQHAAVAVTEGITQMLNEDELEGVLAHELAHVKHRDILIGTIAATLAGAITMISRLGFFFGGSRDDNGGSPAGMLLMMILGPIAAMLIQLGISRTREYAADEGGAVISGKPWALASALRKMERGVQARPMNAEPTTAHMFIVSPFSGGAIASLFSTHPPIAKRVEKLEAMVPGSGSASVRR